jgi:hypothetical protein
MHALKDDEKIYVNILELHKNITDSNVLDSVPVFRIATHEKTDQINWEWIIFNGFMPIVKCSPSILRSTIQEYFFTPEFWICSCDFDWLHMKQYECAKCKDNVITSMKNSPKSTSLLWGDGSFSTIETVVLQIMAASIKSKKEIETSPVITLYKHLKAFDFNWKNAYSIENFSS